MRIRLLGQRSCGDRGPLVKGHLEAEDDGPDEAQRQPVVPVHDVMGSNVLQVNTLLLEKLKSFVHILQAVDPHAPSGGLWL